MKADATTVHRALKHMRQSAQLRQLRERIQAALRAIEGGEPSIEILKTALEESNIPDDAPVLLSPSVAVDTNIIALIYYAQSLERALDRTIEALRPFEAYADQRGSVPIDFQITQGSPMSKRQIIMGDCYRAKDVLDSFDWDR